MRNQIEYKIMCVEFELMAYFAGPWIKQDQIKANYLVERMMYLSNIASYVS